MHACSGEMTRQAPHSPESAGLQTPTRHPRNPAQWESTMQHGCPVSGRAGPQPQDQRYQRPERLTPRKPSTGMTSFRDLLTRGYPAWSFLTSDPKALSPSQVPGPQRRGLTSGSPGWSPGTSSFKGSPCDGALGGLSRLSHRPRLRS